MLFQKPDWKVPWVIVHLYLKITKQLASLWKLVEKVRNGVSTVVRKQISFLCCELFPAFLYFSNTTSCHWLSVNKIEGKIKRLFELGTFTVNKIIRHSLSLSIKTQKKSSKPRKKKLNLFPVFLWFVENYAVPFCRCFVAAYM